jgi:hypothetical protein
MMNTYMIPRKEVGPSTVPAKPAPDLKNETELSASASWDAPEAQAKKKHSPFGASATATGWALSDRFDRILPPHRRYYGRSRRTLLLAILALFLCLLALVVGLAVGLTRKSGGYALPTVYYFRVLLLTLSPSPQNLPLPSNAKTWTGDLTYYGPGLGACGIDSGDGSAIVAISHYTFDAAQTGSDPNQNPLCGRKIRAQRVDERTGKQVSIDVTVVDRCTYLFSLVAIGCV